MHQTQNVIRITETSGPPGEAMPAAQELMKVTIQYFDGCPHWKLADERVRLVLRGLAQGDVKFEYELIDSPEGADRARFRGLPTILIDGSLPRGRRP